MGRLTEAGTSQKTCQTRHIQSFREEKRRIIIDSNNHPPVSLKMVILFMKLFNSQVKMNILRLTLIILLAGLISLPLIGQDSLNTPEFSIQEVVINPKQITS